MSLSRRIKNSSTRATMTDTFAMADLTARELNTIVEMLGGRTGALRFLRGESVSTTTRYF